MLVSRDYLRYDTLIEFPVEERFLKIPIENLLEIEGITPLPSQIALINAIQDPRHKQVMGVS